MMAHGFKIKTGPSGEQYFTYRVRESFRALASKVLILFDGRQLSRDVLRYTGSIGSGKSHNLAALTYYLRTRKAEGWIFGLSVVYISSCELLFIDPVARLRGALCEAFPAEKSTIAACEKWADLETFVATKPYGSILFIFDYWSYVHPENKHTHEERVKRIEDRRMLGSLACDQYRIEGISAECGILTSSSKELLDTPFLYLDGGLTGTEWSTWKCSSSLFQELTEREEQLVVEMTGLVPLYLRILEELPGSDLKSRLAEFEETVGRDIESSMSATSDDFTSTANGDEIWREIFVAQMKAALDGYKTRINRTLYDHRYFYVDDNYYLKPLSGLVHRLMTKYLIAKHADLYPTKTSQ
jgi:hypothetical protein